MKGTGRLIFGASKYPWPTFRLFLIRETVADQAHQRHDPVAPGDFFSLVKVSPVVIDGNLKKFNAAFEDFGGDFGLEIKPVRAQVDRTDEIALEGFVAGFHVSENGVIKNVGDEGQKFVAHVVPEQKGPADAFKA